LNAVDPDDVPDDDKDVNAEEMRKRGEGQMKRH
jgi:hypothetical protein